MTRIYMEEKWLKLIAKVGGTIGIGNVEASSLIS
jgi:hypothetical protein